MTTNKDLRRRETDKLGEWIQQAALDEANKTIAKQMEVVSSLLGSIDKAHKRIAELEAALVEAHNEIGCFLIHCKNQNWDEDYLTESKIVFELLESLLPPPAAAKEVE